MNPRVTTVQTILQLPGTTTPIPNQTCTVRLLPKLTYTADGTVQKARTSYFTSDANGLVTMPVQVNADLDPAGTYYTFSANISGWPIQSFVVTYSATPVTLRSCLVQDPVNPNPIVSPGPTLLIVENTDGTFDLSGSAVTDNGDGTYTIAAA